MHEAIIDMHHPYHGDKRCDTYTKIMAKSLGKAGAGHIEHICQFGGAMAELRVFEYVGEYLVQDHGLYGSE